MSRKANCWDNAVAESFFKTLKVECVYDYKFENQKKAATTVFEYIERGRPCGLVQPKKASFLPGLSKPSTDGATI
jgi:transposase InsO family protein